MHIWYYMSPSILSTSFFGKLFGFLSFIEPFLIFIFLIVLFFVFVSVFKNHPKFVNLMSNYKKHKHHQDDPKYILKIRLAKGEISEEEFENLMKKIINNEFDN